MAQRQEGHWIARRKQFESLGSFYKLVLAREGSRANETKEEKVENEEETMNLTLFKFGYVNDKDESRLIRSTGGTRAPNGTISILATKGIQDFCLVTDLLGIPSNPRAEIRRSALGSHVRSVDARSSNLRDVYGLLKTCSTCLVSDLSFDLRHSQLALLSNQPLMPSASHENRSE
ncbi:hypothetical protein HZH68_004044 [Vespula germanica]|uniref:Uncharacterized protein n=1 Tax=Vespula germanica TaxID=30212 RepID=A0A834KMX1_VESGE|nr:hypothetical protein HZH68_004044 [Vespula germanica]